MQIQTRNSSFSITLILGLLLLSAHSTLAQTGAKKLKRGIDTTAVTPSAPTTQSAQTTWSFLSLGACGVDQFIKDHPTFDGRGTIVVVLDDGVDPGIDGLRLTTEGKRKFIDVQDFSGTGDLFYQAASRNGDMLYMGGTQVLKGLDAKSISPIDGKYFYAALDESHFKNGLGDLNFNGSKTDILGVLLFQDKPNHYVAIIDGDADGDIAGEPTLSNFKENGDLVRLRNSRKERHDERFLSAAVNIFPDEHRINLYFADGGHGTHVAGIAAGCNIDGQQGFNGVAPGAELVALKFADNTMGGVTVTNSMKHAYEYVVKLAQESGKPVIANMSFGIGNELEGKAVMDLWLDSILDAHPEVVVCISAGNEGPGISNIGIPSSSRNVISSGAALPYETARDLYGLATTKTVIWDFSSRGAELAKPTIVSPGTAISTVPDYVTRDRYNGTSMSSPYTTGCCAVLASAMKQTFPNYKPNLAAIKRALELGATHIEGATLLDEGAGLANIPKAFEWLSRWQREGKTPAKYAIKVAVPNVNGNGTAAYYRNGYYPKNSERTTFYITPIDQSGDGSRSSKIGFNAYDLVSNSPWLLPVEQSTYRRGDGPLEVNVKYDEKQLQLPGLYVGKILGYRKGSPKTAADFELWNTVVIPYELTPANNFAVEIKNIPVRNGNISRYFFRIPSGTKAIKLRLTSNEGDPKSADAAIFDNDGKSYQYLRLRPTDDESEEKSRWITGDELREGVWEIDVKRGIGSDDETASSVNLTVEAFPIDYSYDYYSTTGNYVKGQFTLTNNSTTTMETGASKATIEGYERFFDTTLATGDTYTMNFKRIGFEKICSFDLSLDRKDYNLFTDIAYQILKSDSSAVSNNALDWRTGWVEVKFADNDSAIYTLKFKGGLADSDKPHTFVLHFRERRIFDPAANDYKVPITMPVTYLYPAQTETVSFIAPQPLPQIPDRYRFYGNLRISLDRNRFEFPLEYSK